MSTCLNETYHNYSIPDPHDIDDIFKVTGSKVKVTDISQKCTDAGKAYRLTVRRGRPSRPLIPTAMRMDIVRFRNGDDIIRAYYT